MSKTRKLMFLAIPLALTVGVLGYARANAGGPFGHHRHHAPATAAELEERMDDKVEHLLDAVSATKEQRAQTDAIVKQLAPRLFTLMDEGRALRGELKTQLLAEKLDKTRIAESQQKLSALADQAVDASMDGLSAIAEVLTPQQRRLVADKLAKFHL